MTLIDSILSKIKGDKSNALILNNFTKLSNEILIENDNISKHRTFKLIDLLLNQITQE